ncbi:PREDICTED: putative fatty acyl-CoA reductase CG5065 [Wasmannia auropunctata]|uniref:putative fatty acyl-CoA reductase CG5065 n=1 Tax=Wasmannia auropunctata TaxID=64793 RepID=UPI0005EFEAE6|nr:PREDICTED: putative fatty acyl-CoA reductase CG5065 [Wasmannia auropunctata]
MELSFRRGKDMLIYNFVSSVDGPTWNEYFFGLVDINKTFPFRSAVYLPLVTLVKYNILCRICVWFGHFLPALLVDAANICIGRSPRMWKLCMAIDKFSRVIQPFCTSVEWSYSTDNVQAMWNHLNEKDQQLFKFSMMGFDWSKYLIDCHEGIRHYLVKEDDSMLESGHIKYRRFYWIHQIDKVIFLFIAFWIIWCMLTVCINYSL